MDPLTTINTRHTPQSEQADARQQKNAAGGYAFTVDDLTRLKRFLTLGTDGGTYYATARDLTKDNAHAVVRLLAYEPRLLIDTIVDVSVRGAAPKQNPAIFALAIAASHGDEQAYALAQVPKVCRTGTHLFLFARYVEQFRGWGRALRRAVGEWYLDKTPDQAAFQAVKYRQREGWSHRDLLRLAHPATLDPAMRATFDWIVRNSVSDEAPAIIQAFTRAHEPGADVAAIVRDSDLSWEMLPDAALGEPAVWEALLDRGMPQTALMRQLPRLTRLGLLPRTGGRTAEIAARLADSERLHKARVHPVNVLIAQRTYAAGRSTRGESVWAPTRQIVDALDAAFYHAFGAVEPAGKRTMLALDVSGSMVSPISGLPISCREASAALALVQMATEPECDVVGFTSANWAWESSLTPLSISPRQRLDDAIRTVADLPFGGTDCALPVLHALKHRQEVDTFVIYTDNETWAGTTHPHQALVEYREKMGIPARMIVVGMTATECSIADPSDPGMLDVAGFDSAVPNLIADFSRGF
ncbi:MAG: TROVE domain-containing protein [Propionibacteriaceae bacterium]|nr:TROVE domain-containing protein [Propionibacteriaceae bacterium]